MSKQIIGIGTTANDNTGDPLRTAFTKTNENFDELYAQTGWMSYTDTLHTVAAPQTVAQGVTALFTNNGGTKLSSQKPTGVNELFDVATTKLTPENENDFYTVDLMFKAKNSVLSGVFIVYIEIVGVGEKFYQHKITSKTANLELGYNISFSHFVSNAFLVNGGEIKIEAIEGNLSIYDKQFRICRIHKAR